MQGSVYGVSCVPGIAGFLIIPGGFVIPGRMFMVSSTQLLMDIVLVWPRTRLKKSRCITFIPGPGFSVLGQRGVTWAVSIARIGT